MWKYSIYKVGCCRTNSTDIFDAELYDDNDLWYGHVYDKRTAENKLKDWVLYLALPISIMMTAMAYLISRYA